jgi:hypothetical protein
MPRNGSGTYTRPQADYVPGTTILATSVNSDLNDMAQALTASLARDGQTTPTANIPLGGFRITGMGNGTSATDAATLGQVDAVEAIARAQNRNLIINGNPVINQRAYVSGTATSGANQYTLDRWRVVTSGQSVSWTDSAGIRTVTAPAGGMEQVIEALNNLGGVHTLSWTGTATATVDGSSVANGAQVTLTGNTNVTIRLTGGTWDRVQLEPGTVATPFERRQYGQELALCQRYYETGTIWRYAGYNGTDGSAVYWKAVKRVSPILTVTVISSGGLVSGPTLAGNEYSAEYAFTTTGGFCHSTFTAAAEP